MADPRLEDPAQEPFYAAGTRRSGPAEDRPAPSRTLSSCSGDYAPVYPPEARPITVSSYEACASDRSALNSSLFAVVKTCVSPG